VVAAASANDDSSNEDNVLAIMQENLKRLWRGETQLLNEVG